MANTNDIHVSKGMTAQSKEYLRKHTGKTQKDPEIRNEQG